MLPSRVLRNLPARRLCTPLAAALVTLLGGCGPLMMLPAGQNGLYTTPYGMMGGYAARGGALLLQQTFTSTPYTASFTTLAADDAVTVAVRANNAASRPAITVTDPNGAVVAQQTAGTSFVTLSLTSTAAAAYSVSVTETGTAASVYTISVAEASPTGAGYTGFMPMMYGFGPMMGF